MRVPLRMKPGLNSDDTTYAAAGAWADCNNVRFWEGRPQTIGGWESLTTELLSGVCRSAFPWTDNIGALNVGFGTHSHFQVWIGGTMADITPTLGRPSFTLVGSPVAVIDGSAVLTITVPLHGLDDGEEIEVSGDTGVGRIVPEGVYAVAVTDENTFTITASSSADLDKTLTSNPLAVESGKPTVTVTETGHNISTGTSITVSGATAFGGITPNGTFVATRIDEDHYSFTFDANATSTATGGGAAVVVTVPATGGAGIVIAPQRPFEAGAEHGTGTTGYSTGAYGVGAYSEPSTANYFPRTWAQGAWGQQLLASPRGGTIYLWDNDLGAVAKPLANAPALVTHMVVAPQDMVFALGCNEEASGKFNPMCVRHSGVRKNTVWRTGGDTTAREYILPGGGRIVAGRFIGPYLLIWTDHSLFLGTWLGTLQQPWKFDRVAQNCGLIGPNAVVVVDQAAYWPSGNGQFFRYALGGGVQPIPCPIRSDFFDNLTPAQADKIVGSSISRFTEVRWDYPDNRDGVENSRYVALSLGGQGWYRGKMARSAFVDAGPSTDPIGVTPAGNVYWHERGHSADGQPLKWRIETADQYLSEDLTAMVLGLWPDVKNQIGPIGVSIVSRFKPQGDEVTKGPFPMAAGEDKVDFRCSGRLFRLSFAGESVPSYARLGQIAVNLAPAGKR